MPSGNPAQDVDLPGICKPVQNLVWNDLQQSMGCGIPVVIDVLLHLDAVNPVDGLRVAFVKC